MATITLEELLKEVGSCPEILNDSISDDHLREIALFLTSWQTVASHLDLNENDLEDAERGGRKVKDKSLKALQIWRGKFGFKATYRKLVEVLLSLAMADLAEKVCKLLIEDVPVLVSGTDNKPQSGLREHGGSEAGTTSATGLTSVLSIQTQFQQLSSTEQEELKGMLCDDVREMKRLFGSLVTRTCESVEQRIQVVMFANHILALGAYDPAPEERDRSLLDEHRQEIKGAKSIPEIFIILSAYWNYLNYEILEYIIEHYGTSDDTERLRDYDEKLHNFCKRRIFEVPMPVRGNGTENKSSPKQEQLNVKLDVREDIPAEQFNRIKGKIAKILHVRPATLQICSIAKGCVQLIFLIPKFVAQELFPLSCEQTSALSKDVAVIRLECGDYTFEAEMHTEDAVTHSTVLEGMKDKSQPQTETCAERQVQTTQTNREPQTTEGSIMDNCGQSARSATTGGGVEFDDLVTGRVGPSYTFRLTRIKSTCKQVECAPTHSRMDPEHTATTTKGNQDSDALHKATDTLVKWVDDTITDIEIQSGKKVVKFYIGKTFVRQIKNRKFDAMNRNTWRKSGISSRWCRHRQEDYGRNGMVVLTVVTKDDVPQQSIPAFKHQEMYALTLEQQLIIHYAFIRGDERLANTSTHPGMQQQEESTRAIGYPIYMAFALDDRQTDLSDEVLERDVEECYITIDQGESLAGEETSVTELQDQRLTMKQEEAIVSASELSASFRQETLQQAQNSSSSNQRHIHFLNEDTICGIDSVPWDSPEPPMKEASSDNNTDLIQPSSTQPHDEHVLVSTHNEKSPVEVGTADHLLSERKRPSSEKLENSPCQKKQRLENSSSSSSGTTKYQLKKSQHLGRVVPEPGDSKDIPIVVDEPSVGEQMMQLQNQDKQPTSSEAKQKTSDINSGEKPFVKAHIQGTEIVAQKAFTVTQEAVDLVFEGYGFKLHVPEDALPAEVSETQLDVQVSLSGHFQMPSDSRLISAVYWVSSPHKLMKPITVEIQHCATLTNDEQCSHLTFVHSMCSQEKLPYMFMEQDGGVFTPHSSYGILSLPHFSGLGVIVKCLLQILLRPQAIDAKPKQQQCIQPVQSALGQAGQAIDSGLEQQQLPELSIHTETASETEQEEEGEVVEQYCAQLYTTKLVKEWKADFVVTKNLDSCLTVVRKEYYPHGLQQFSFIFAFKKDFISFKMPKDQELNGWKITPYYNPKITRQQVDHFSSGKRIPRCELVLRWCRDPPPACLQCEIDLLGACDHSYFLLHVNPDAEASTATQNIEVQTPSKLLHPTKPRAKTEPSLQTDEPLDLQPSQRLDTTSDFHPLLTSEQVVQTYGDTNVTSTEYLRGFEAFKETSFVVTDSHSFEWQKYGFKLHIPKGTVSAEHTECRVNIKVGLAGQFSIPDELQLVSCIYWLSCPQKFMKPVTLEIEHCASLQDSSQSSSLQFIVAKCSQAELPYQFRALEKGTFVPRSSYGSIQISQFSFFGIGILKRFLSLQHYCGAVYYIRKDVNKWHVDFVITSSLSVSLTAMQDVYSSLNAVSGPDLEVEFETDNISLSIPEDGICLQNGWTIKPLVPPVITKQQVDGFQPGRRVPYCRLQVKLNENCESVELEHKVKLLGAKKPFDYFMIICPPEEKSERQTSSKRKWLEERGKSGVSFKKRHLNDNTLSPSSSAAEGGMFSSSVSSSPRGRGADRTSSLPQLKDLVGALYHKVADKWKMIGVLLEVPKGKLATIADKYQRDPHKCLVEMLETWLDRLDPPATWSAIIEAVEFLGDEQLGKELRENYIN